MELKTKPESGDAELSAPLKRKQSRPIFGSIFLAVFDFVAVLSTFFGFAGAFSFFCRVPFQCNISGISDRLPIYLVIRKIDGERHDYSAMFIYTGVRTVDHN